MTAELKQMETSDPRETPLNLGDLLRQRVSAAPDTPFLFSEADGRKFTYAEFREAVNRAARMLFSHGIGKGDVVSLLMPNSAEYIIAYFACWQLGTIAGPINSLLKSHEIAFVISDSEAKALLIHSEFVSTIESVWNDLLTLEFVGY
jgi:acyl-CoA synthetase (AMP-forming)/AMP-acid ligase II